MKINLIKRIAKRDAILLYAFYADKLRREPNALRKTSYERIAVELNDANCATSRGFAFTAAVVRSCVVELERSGVATREIVAPGKFDLELRDPTAPTDDPPFKDDLPESDAPERDRSETRAAATPLARSRARKNSNKNKLINKDLVSCSEKDLSEKDDRPTVDDVVARFDFTTPKARSFRDWLLRDLYEPGLHADLIDRTICAVWKKYVGLNEVKIAIREAQEEKRVREATNGYKGAKTLWQTFCLRVKSWYDEAGVRWTPTSFRRERPIKPRLLASTP
ncbi:MAG: hypothetical protein IJM54_09495 [Thermoguttaceae bacterium]|nr:hypothetical protein [Thermoguttaceae bacterium]